MDPHKFAPFYGDRTDCHNKRIFNNNIINKNKLSKLKSPDEIIRRSARLSSASGENRTCHWPGLLYHSLQMVNPHWPPPWNGHFKGEHAPHSPLEACTFSTHLGNRSVFILDLRLHTPRRSDFSLPYRELNMLYPYSFQNNITCLSQYVDVIYMKYKVIMPQYFSLTVEAVWGLESCTAHSKQCLESQNYAMNSPAYLWIAICFP